MFDKLWLEWMTHPGIGCVVLGFRWSPLLALALGWVRSEPKDQIGERELLKRLLALDNLQC